MMAKLKGKRQLGRSVRRWGIILKLISKICDRSACTGLIWLRILRSGGLSWTR